ncbi:organ-specific protein S2-like [Macadamia integrifolia]|uniref:organ-specific protein S2-like n=1 Tax=Macadamia integrifolia TaxID=60698 RepID=UPI001C4E3A61|nr:organ-specific protein S2-like [Macadamia integrifolia]
MKSVLAFLILSSLFLFTSSVDARKDPSEYWKDVMKDQPMPEAIQDLLSSNPGSVSPLENQKEKKFNLDKNLYSIAIIYHGLDEHKEDKIPRKDSELSLEVGQEEKKSSVN